MDILRISSINCGHRHPEPFKEILRHGLNQIRNNARWPCHHVIERSYKDQGLED